MLEADKSLTIGHILIGAKSRKSGDSGKRLLLVLGQCPGQALPDQPPSSPAFLSLYHHPVCSITNHPGSNFYLKIFRWSWFWKFLHLIRWDHWAQNWSLGFTLNLSLMAQASIPLAHTQQGHCKGHPCLDLFNLITKSLFWWARWETFFVPEIAYTHLSVAFQGLGEPFSFSVLWHMRAP